MECRSSLRRAILRPEPGSRWTPRERRCCAKRLPGFGDQREIELLVEAGFTPVQAIQIATENGATYLSQQDHIGTIAPGKQADLVLIKGDPSKNIEEIENVETVFK